MATGAEGQPKVLLSHLSGSTAEVYLYGAHVTSWVPAGGREMMFLSERAVYGGGKSIRGGVPVVFPQFADRGPLPKHGFARLQTWEAAEEAAGADRVLLRLTDSEETRALWPHVFLATVEVVLEERTLTVRLSVRNTGAEPFAFTSALHTYFRVADVRRASVEGLGGTRTFDKAAGGVSGVEEDDRVSVAGEVDRVYIDAPPEVRLRDEAGGRVLRIRQEGFADTVVWNPWVEIARAQPDLRDDEYLEMLCVEAAQVEEPVRLAPGERWTGAQAMTLG